MLSAPATDMTLRPRWAFGAAIIAIAFGFLSFLVGGAALFGGSRVSAAFGDTVGFVIWFNFCSSFLYMLAGVGLLLWRRWAALLSAGIAVAAFLVFVAFGWHIAQGGAFEMRTLVAMTIRTGFWVATGIATCHAFDCLWKARSSAR